MKMKEKMKNSRIKCRFFTAILAVILVQGQNVFAASSADSATVREKYNQGIQFQQNENYYTASQYYLEVVAQNPAFTDAWYKLAECSYKLGEFDLALQYLESAEKYEKNNLQIQNLKGMVYVSIGEIEKGREIFNSILKKYPNDIDAHFGLAEIELYEGRYSGAQNQYLEALKRQNTNRKALLSLALVNAERGSSEQADTYLRQALAYYSGEPEVHYLASIIYSMKGDYSAAEKQARIAVEINSNYEKAYDMLSSVLYQQARYNEVIDISDYLISRNRKNSNAWFIKGIAQCKLGKVDSAIETWTAGLSINPQDEIMRSAMENEIRNSLSLEDSRRTSYAKYHIDNAKQYASRYDGSGAVYEYQRALLLDPISDRLDEFLSQGRLIPLRSRADLPQAAMIPELAEFLRQHGLHPIDVSTVTRAGLSDLENALIRISRALSSQFEDVTLITSERHIAHLSAASQALRRALSALDSQLPAECIAADIRDAAENLSIITGEFASEDILNEIFSHFCIGK